MIANSLGERLFITGCWKTTWTWIEETGSSQTDERKSRQSRGKIPCNYYKQLPISWQKKTQETKEKGVMQTKSWCGFTQTTPGSHAESRFGRKETREKKGIMQTKSWCGFTQTIPGSHVESRFDRKETREKKGVMQTGRIYTETELWVVRKQLEEDGRKKENCKKTDQEIRTRI